MKEPLAPGARRTDVLVRGAPRSAARPARGQPRGGGREPCLRMLVHLAADWYWEADASHRITCFLPSSGCEVRESMLDLQPQRELLERRRAFRNVPLLAASAGGGQRHLVISGEPVFGRRAFAGYRGVGNDITGYREAQLALNASESQLAAVIDAATEAVITVDAQGRIVVFNEAAGAMFGCRRADALGAPLQRFLPGALPFAPCRDEAGRGPGRAPRVLACSLPLRGVRPNGGDFPLEASISLIQLQGRTLYCLVLRDLTERVAAEEARRTLESQLRQSQKMEALGTLAGGIAHDFNNIVAAILGNAELARANLQQPQLTQVFLGEISKAGLRARDLVQRIMAFSRNQPPLFRCQLLHPLIEEGVQLLRAMLPSGIEVVYQAESRSLYVNADGSQISQVLMNLGTNAWQSLGSAPGQIIVRLRECNGEARMAVTDTGCGMDAATIQRIFEPFYTTKAKGEGTGLGLPVVHGIVRSHGGHIEVTSVPGRGSTFEVSLPLVPQPECAAPEPPASPAGEVRGRGQHVLYLDDYPAMVFMMTATLQARGFRVSGFGDAREALAWLSQHAAEVDLVVTDYNMPGCSGLELAGEVARLRPGLPLILASGLITEELRQGAAKLGVEHLFDKPRGIEELCALVARVLGVAPAQGMEGTA